MNRIRRAIRRAIWRYVSGVLADFEGTTPQVVNWVVTAEESDALRKLERRVNGRYDKGGYIRPAAPALHRLDQ